MELTTIRGSAMTWKFGVPLIRYASARTTKAYSSFGRFATLHAASAPLANPISSAHVCSNPLLRGFRSSAINAAPSEYCQYDKTSLTYDMARVPLDLDDLIERIEKLAAKRGCPVSDLKLLDVGAGSGNYFQGLRARGCARCAGWCPALRCAPRCPSPPHRCRRPCPRRWRLQP